MTYAKNSVITAADYNTFAGVTGSAAASSAAATNVAGYLWGIGYGDRGYGASSPNLVAVSTGNCIASVGWTNLQNAISNLATHQGTATTLLPPSSLMNAGAAVVAHSTASGNAYDFATMLSLVDTNRFTYDILNMTLTSSAASSTRATAWSTSIQAIFTLTFTDENAARYFFNSGGDIRISLSHPDVSTPQNSSWNSILNNFTMAFAAHATTRLSGSYGSAQSVGYYELSTTYQTIVDGSNTGTGAYATNDFLIEAAAASITGLNGAKGSVINFRITLTDEYTGFSDVVSSGTVATLGHLRSTTLPNITAPSCAVTLNF
jgi:hypothetical protein